MSATKKTTKKVETAAADSVKDGFEKVSKTMSEMGEVGRENFEAVVSSATVVTKALEGLAADNTAFAKEAIENTVENMKSVATIKSPQEFVEKQAAFFQSAFEANVSQMTKMSEAFMATSQEATEPLNKRYTAMVDMAQSFRL